MSKYGLALGLAFVWLACSAFPSAYRVQPGIPLLLPNVVQPQAACNWLGIAGQVVDHDGHPVNGLVVRVFGRLGNQSIQRYAISGGSFLLGAGGFDLMLAEHPQDSQGALFLQLFDVVGRALSAPEPFNTSARCDQNLVLMNWVEIPQDFGSFLPYISTGEE